MKKTTKTAPPKFLINTPIALLLRSKRVVSILPAGSRERPMSAWVKRTGISRMHFYRVISGQTKATETMIGKLARGTKLTERAIRSKLNATWAQTQGVLS